jgi:hypothetical protein
MHNTGDGLQGEPMGWGDMGRNYRCTREIHQACVQEHVYAMGGHGARGRGIMTIMRQETPEGRDPERWRNARERLRRLPGWGIRTVQEVQKERTLILPDMLRRMMKEGELKELEWAVENEGVQLKIVWIGEEQRHAQTPRTPKLREAARGEELIGDTV